MKTPRQAYVAYVLQHGARPPSVQSFAESLGLSEADFYQSYASFEALEAEIFNGYLEETIAQLEADPDYLQYDVAGKLLSVYYTWLAVLNEQRSLVAFMDRKSSALLGAPPYQELAREEFIDLVQRIVKQGLETGELADRWFLSRYYQDLIWVNARFVLDYWLHDRSRSFERTDAAIEKSVRFTLDLIRPNAIDSGVDLLRFLWRGKPSG